MAARGIILLIAGAALALLAALQLFRPAGPDTEPDPSRNADSERDADPVDGALVDPAAFDSPGDDGSPRESATREDAGRQRTAVDPDLALVELGYALPAAGLPPCALIGRVVDAEERPIPEVAVVVSRVQELSRIPRVGERRYVRLGGRIDTWSTTTSDDGTFRVEGMPARTRLVWSVDPGGRRMLLSLFDAERSQDWTQLEAGETRDLGDLLAEPTHETIRGRVVDERGAPVSGAFVGLDAGRDRLTLLDEPALLLTRRKLDDGFEVDPSWSPGSSWADVLVRPSTTTDPGGFFMLRGVRRIETFATVVVAHRDFTVTTAATHQVFPAEQVEIGTLTLDRGGTLDVAVEDADGRPVSGAMVHAGHVGYARDGTRIPIDQARSGLVPEMGQTDRRGRVTRSGYLDASYRVVVTTDELVEPYVAGSMRPGNTLRVALPRQVSLTIVPTSARRSPLGEVSVDVRKSASRDAISRIADLDRRPDGRCVIEGLAAEPYVVTVTARDHYRSQTFVDLTNGPTVEHITLEPIEPVEVQVVDSVSGRALSGATVELIRGSLIHFGPAVRAEHTALQSHVTDGEGRVEMDGVAGRFLSVRASVPGYEADQQRLSSSASSRPIVLRPEPYGVVTGRLLGLASLDVVPAVALVTDEQAVLARVRVDASGRFALPACPAGPARLVVLGGAGRLLGEREVDVEPGGEIAIEVEVVEEDA